MDNLTALRGSQAAGRIRHCFANDVDRLRPFPLALFSNAPFYHQTLAIGLFPGYTQLLIGPGAGNISSFFRRIVIYRARSGQIDPPSEFTITTLSKSF
jgi:hypothetical protein